MLKTAPFTGHWKTGPGEGERRDASRSRHAVRPYRCLCIALTRASCHRTTLAGHLLECSHAYTGSGYQAHACRILGQVALRHEPLDVDQAAAHYHQALALAEELGLRPLQDVLPPGARHSLCQDWPAAAGAGRTVCHDWPLRAMEMTFWLPQVEAALAEVGDKKVL